MHSIQSTTAFPGIANSLHRFQAQHRSTSVRLVYCLTLLRQIRNNRSNAINSVLVVLPERFANKLSLAVPALAMWVDYKRVGQAKVDSCPVQADIWRHARPAMSETSLEHWQVRADELLIVIWQAHLALEICDDHLCEARVMLLTPRRFMMLMPFDGQFSGDTCPKRERGHPFMFMMKDFKGLQRKRAHSELLCHLLSSFKSILPLQRTRLMKMGLINDLL